MAATLHREINSNATLRNVRYRVSCAQVEDQEQAVEVLTVKLWQWNNFE